MSQHGDKWRHTQNGLNIHDHHHITMGVVGAIVYVLGLWGPNFPYSCCLQHRLIWPCWPSSGCRVLSSFYFTHTTQSGPCPAVSASARGEGVQTEGAHRTLKDIEALYRFGLPGGRLNAKRRRASPHIASSWQPAEPPFRAEPPEATTRPFNGHLIPAGIERTK